MKTIALAALTVALATAGIGEADAQRGRHGDSEIRHDVARVVDVDRLPGRGGPDRTYQECWNERYDRYDSGYYRDERGRLYREKDDGTAGALIGALIGGAIGNQVGDGKGRTAATIAGAVAGGAIGKRADERDAFRYRDDRGVETRCRTVTEQNHRPGGYRVTYVYGGETYRTVTSRHPGRSLPVVVEVRPQDEYLADYRR